LHCLCLSAQGLHNIPNFLWHKKLAAIYYPPEDDQPCQQKNSSGPKGSLPSRGWVNGPESHGRKIQYNPCQGK
jgi:hypothetical protein